MSLIQCEMALNRNCKTPESKSIKADSNWEVAVVYVNLLKFTETEIKPKGRILTLFLNVGGMRGHQYSE